MTIIKLDLINDSPTNRPIDQSHAESLAADIKRHGLRHRPTVIANGERFDPIAGLHRIAAFRLNGETEIDCNILPDTTTQAERIEISISENHVRKNETFEETVTRIEQIAQLKSCSFAKAAEAAGVKPAYASKCLAAKERLCDDAKKLTQEHRSKLGVSLVYLVATKAKSDAEQIEFLESLLDGTMKRADIERAAKASRSPKTIKLNLNVGGIDIRLSSIPADADYDCLVELLGQVKAKFLMHKRNEVPVRLLPDMLSQSP